MKLSAHSKLRPRGAGLARSVRDAQALLTTWNSFYVMIGSSAAALTGLMFVVITLVSESNRRASQEGVSTFSTPTVVHFCYALFTAALMSAPFRSLVPVALILGLAGVAGVLYVLCIGHRTSKMEMYQPDAEDWACNVLVPFVAYALLLTGAIAMQGAPTQALYAPALAVTLLIFVGIHNAWDVVTYLATGKAETASSTSANASSPNSSD